MGQDMRFWQEQVDRSIANDHREMVEEYKKTLAKLREMLLNDSVSKNQVLDVIDDCERKMLERIKVIKEYSR